MDVQEQGRETAPGAAEKVRPTRLNRALTLPLLTLYGLGVTIGAGIYVLVGTVAGEAGMRAPVSFLIAAAVVAFTAFSYAELGTRYPVSAGEAEYVWRAFNRRALSTLIGLLIVTAGIVSSAAISIGAANYLAALVPLPPTALIVIVVVILAAAAIWGIVESVSMAAFFTLVEIGGLAFVIGYAVWANDNLFANAGSILPGGDFGVWGAVMSGALLAFFAFVGFEDIANVAEEVREPGRTLPRAIILTLVVSTLIYFAVVTVTVLAVPLDRLKESAAPLALIFEKADPRVGIAFSVVAIVATANGVLIQMIMASRVIYGLASQGSLPAVLGRVNPVTRTPVIATLLVVSIILVLALAVPIAALAERTSQVVLVVFMFVNLALLRLKWRAVPADGDIFVVPAWVPVLGLLSSGFLLAQAFV